MVYINAQLANAGISLIVAYSLTFWVERSNNWKCVCSRRVEIREDITTEDKLEYYCVPGTDGTLGSFNSKKINVYINNKI